MQPSDARPRPDVTDDALFGGALTLRQPARGSGYRVNVDAILLAAFAGHALAGGGLDERRTARLAVDLGAGVGAVSLSLLHLGLADAVTLVEVDAAVAALARENLAENAYADVGQVVVGDVRQTDAAVAPKADLVVCNPPYVPPGRGREPAAALTSAKYGQLDAFVWAARRVAGRRARVAFVYPAIETTTLLETFRSAGLEPKRLRTVHGRVGDRARVVLVECVAGKPGGLAIEPPLFECDASGVRTGDLEGLLATPRSSRTDR